MQSSYFSKLAPSRWLFALAAPLALSLVATGCGTQQCQSMKSSGSAFASIFCGGEGDPAPEAADGGPNACSDISQVMPEFFQLLDDNQLTGIQQAVEQIGEPTCADDIHTRQCNADTVCTLGYCDTTSNLCPCQNFYNPLGDLLESTFQGLAVVASPTQPAEPGAVAPSKCVDAVAAEALPQSQRNPLCEIRRTIDFLVNQNGGAQLFNDPAVTQVLVALLNYIQGDYTPPAGATATPHYDLFTTFGLMAQNPGVCDPLVTYDLLDKALIYLTPARGTQLITDVNALLNDPTTVGFLTSLQGTGGVTGRQAVITILNNLLPGIRNAPDGATALSPVDSLLTSLVYGSSSFPDSFKNEIRKVLSDLGCVDNGNVQNPACAVPDDPIMGSGLLGPGAGIFPDITLPSQQTGLLWCLSSVDPTGNLVGALYDLLTFQSTAPSGSINIPTLLNAIQELLALDPTGQTNRTLRFVVESISADPTAVEALRELLASTLTPTVGQELIPPVSLLIQKQVVGEILDLLQDILYNCSPPNNSQSSSPGH